jgi:transcriptional regulator with XRE-family HTH domain
MLAPQYGSLIKKERLAQKLTQVDLARAAQVSRAILSKLEQEKPRPVQTDVLDRILQTLNIKPQLVADSIVEERRWARLLHQASLEKQRNRHLRLAVELATHRKKAQQLIAKAKSVVELWRTQDTCSPFYIERWSELLALPPGELAKKMASLGDWEDALFQNTPWSWMWT